jgi:NAD(P)-dependent dehydrogenase (short-subunit alcohol dehydrogenase family)
MRAIGRHIALALAKRGCKIVVTGTGRDAATFPEDEKTANWRGIDSVAQEVKALGSEVLPLVVDVTSEDQVQRMVNTTLEAFGRLDILVHNAHRAGQADRVSILDMDLREFQSVLDVKLLGAVRCAKAVGRVLVKQGQGGRIINISSVLGKKARPDTSAYITACFGLNGLTQALAWELAPYNITVNAVCPGPTDTWRHDQWKQDRDSWQRRLSLTALNRVGTPEESASVVAFLCTEGASYITGQCINVNGGEFME